MLDGPPKHALRSKRSARRSPCAPPGRPGDLALDALVVTCLPNVFYLTNFLGSAATVVVTTDRFYFVTDFRYVTAFEASLTSPSACPDAVLVRVERILRQHAG